MHLKDPHRTILFAFLSLLCGVTSYGQQPSSSASPTSTAATVSPPAKKDSFHIYLLMGQSNMAGRDTRGLAAQTTDPRVLAMTPEGQWVVAKDPIHQKDGRTEPGVGPGISFGLAMIKANPGVIIGLVPCAVGGTPLKRWQ